MRGRFLPYAVLAVVVGAVFSLGVNGGFLSGDDTGYTCGCPFVRDGMSFANVVASLRELCYCAIWMPVTFFTYMADVSLWGGGWSVHHATNVAIHVLNACLVFAFLKMLLRRFQVDESKALTGACLAATLVWAVHPMRVESVTYVASRKEELWTLFAVVGLIGWIRYLERGGWRRYAVVMACFVLSCMSKPTAVCFPLLAYGVKAALDRRLATRCLSILPMLAVSVAVGVLTVHSQAHPTGMAQADVFIADFDWRVLNAAVSLGLYVWHVFVPWVIHVDYRAVFNGWPVDGGLGLAVLAVVAVTSSLTLVYARDERLRRVLLFAGFWFLAGLGPTLGVFGYVNGDQAYADRYSYLPSVALSLLLAYGLVAASRSRRVFGLSAVVALAAVAVEIAVTLPVVRSFGSDYLAFSRTLKFDPDHWRALRVVGNEYCARQNRMDEGIAMLRRSLRHRGSQRTADSLAYVLAIRGAAGDFDEVETLGKVAAHDVRRDVGGMMLDALGIVRMRKGDYEGAARFFAASLKAPRREHAVRHSILGLGLCLANVGRDREAVVVLERLRQDPDAHVRARAQTALRQIAAGGSRAPFAWQ